MERDPIIEIHELYQFYPRERFHISIFVFENIFAYLRYNKCVKRDLHTSKETYKRDQQKRLTEQETYELYQYQTRERFRVSIFTQICTWKETPLKRSTNSTNFTHESDFAYLYLCFDTYLRT